MELTGSSAFCCSGFGVVVTSNVQSSGGFPVRHRLRVIVERLARSVRKLWTGVPSSVVPRDPAFRITAGEGFAGLTGSRAHTPVKVRVGEKRRSPCGTHMPLDIVGKHAKEDMGPDPVGQPVMDRPHDALWS